MMNYKDKIKEMREFLKQEPIKVPEEPKVKDFPKVEDIEKVLDEIDLSKYRKPVNVEKETTKKNNK